jgi:hypothetical protein
MPTASGNFVAADDVALLPLGPVSFSFPVWFSLPACGLPRAEDGAPQPGDTSLAVLRSFREAHSPTRLRAALGSDATGDGRLDAFDTNQVGSA